MSRHGSTLLFSSDRSGTLQPYRMETKRGESQQAGEAKDLHPEAIVISPDEKSFYYLDGLGLHQVGLSNQRERLTYRLADGWEAGYGLGLSSDGLYAALIEKLKGQYRLRLLNTIKGQAATLVEATEELSLPAVRPRRAGVLYRRKDSELWLVNFDGHENRRLTLADGLIGPAVWSKDGRMILYLSFPPEPRRSRNIREYAPDFNQDAWITDTSQFASFGANGDGSVFVGASASKASPYVLLSLRTVRRELAICEHRASNPALVAPVFSPDSQRVFFQSDKEGKMAIYMINVERLVEETEA